MADFQLDTSGVDRFADRAARIIDRIEKHAAKAIAETAYQYSYDPGSTRYYQANRRAHVAEASFSKAVAELRTLIEKGRTARLGGPAQ